MRAQAGLLRPHSFTQLFARPAREARAVLSGRLLIVPGGPHGLEESRRTRIALDYRLHYETGLFVGDFNADGKPDLACLGYTNTGVGAGGPLAAYIYLQKP